MKRMLVLVALTAITLCLRSNDAAAQPANSMMQDMSMILVDTTYIRASEITFKPGYKTDVHTHPAHFFYAMTDGHLKVTYESGEVVSFTFKAGEYGFSMPEGPHYAENLGKKPITFLLVELKEHPYKAMMR